FGVVAIDRWPAAHSPPSEDELLHRCNLTIDAAGDICEVIVEDHFLPPLAAHSQVHDDGVRGNGPAVVEEPLKVLGIGPCLEDQISRRVEDSLQGKAALQSVRRHRNHFSFGCGGDPVPPASSCALTRRSVSVGSPGWVDLALRSATIVFSCSSRRPKRFSKNARYGVIHASTVWSGATSSRHGRHCAARPLGTRPPFSSTFT